MRPVALRERDHPETMILQRKTILRDAGVIGEAVVRLRH
jgi:4-hydroxy-tetrahydrodipicolinate synthase